MAAGKGSQDSSDRRQWHKIFNAIVHMLKTQQIQLESLVKERSILEDRIKIQHDRWVSDVLLLEDQISLAEMGILLEAAKTDLVVGLKQREAVLYKLKLERADSELDDFKLCFDYLTHKCSGQKDKSQEKIKENEKGKKGGGDDERKSVGSTKEEEQRSKILEGEVRKLKRAYEKLTSKNSSEVSALLSERNFVWNQFKKIESDYTSLLKSKHVKVDQANEKVEELLAGMERLQSSNTEKDDTILKLKTNLAKLEEDTNNSNKEISRLSRELELLRKSRSSSVTPVLNRCTTKPSTCSLGSKKDGRDRSRPIVKKELAGSQVSDPVKDTEKIELGFGTRVSPRFRSGSEWWLQSSGMPSYQCDDELHIMD
ncbi:hypothetical protein HHK36_010271 [Tetracentron sinense]|uniref:Uncharacterized protein n=1 Tax=Tetracentron sinense TaxID=13715 RepID=A0A834ZN46_TETSI|nr:hypothetical protein HHK36_010271 [Tetracentron sinense]